MIDLFLTFHTLNCVFYPLSALLQHAAERGINYYVMLLKNDKHSVKIIKLD